MNIKALKSKRVLKGISQSEMAERLGISLVTYNKKETGKIEFKRDEIEKIAVILELSISDVDEIFFDKKLAN